MLWRACCRGSYRDAWGARASTRVAMRRARVRQCHLVFEPIGASKTFYVGHVLFMACVDSTPLFNLYQQLALAVRFSLAAARNRFEGARRYLYRAMQRLRPWGTLASSAAELVQGLVDSLLSRYKRVREKKIGLSTGGYCQARQNLPKLLVDRTMDELLERLRRRLMGTQQGLARRLYLLDGSSLQLEHEPELVEAFPPARNQHGKAHWPVIRIVPLRSGDGSGRTAVWGTIEWSEGGQRTGLRGARHRGCAGRVGDRGGDLVARCLLPKRHKRRSCPREVRGRRCRSPIKRREKN